jgi:hypothetical protein
MNRFRCERALLIAGMILARVMAPLGCNSGQDPAQAVGATPPPATTTTTVSPSAARIPVGKQVKNIKQLGKKP